MSRLTQSIHLCFSLPRFLLPGGTISSVFLPTYSLSRLFTWPNHLSRAFLHLSAILSTFSLSLMLSFLTWSLSVWLHAHLHIFISVTSSFFTWELVTGTVSIPYSIGLYRDVWIAAIASSTTSLATRTAAICVRFQGRRVHRVYVTMQITFLTRKSALIYRRGLRQRVASLTLNCNGVLAIRAYSWLEYHLVYLPLHVWWYSLVA